MCGRVRACVVVWGLCGSVGYVWKCGVCVVVFGYVW